ncbi:uncharacterized protein raw isoform X2 [Halyomorpha halys]|uniref:uncharacterized protein raw isoform X2 n=1 Tax=Halyomorpha halys TaxID=286706 RepID=UPI0034D1BEEF
MMCLWGERTSICWEVLTAWIRRRSATIKHIPSENVQSLLNDMHLCPTQAPVGAMLECAKEVGERGNHLNYGGIYNKFSQPKRSRGNSRHISKNFDRNGQEKKRRPRKMSKRNVGRDVFLGGSCNPTTWRKDEAIPLLEDLGISYFNPQVSEWTADLVAVEHNAKESASVLFYVLDRRTRNVVGIIEAANFAGTQRNLVLVTDPYKEGEPVAGENISHVEYEELCGGLSTLHDLVASQGIIVHSNIREGIKWTAKILGNNNTKSRSKESLKESLKFLNGTTQEEVLRKNKEIMSNSEKNDVHLPYYLSTNKTLTDLNGLTTKADPNDGIKINFQQLRMMMRGQNTTSEINRMYCNSSLNGTSCRYDIYIGGSCFDYEWKETVALPILRQSRLKYTFAERGSLKSSRANQHELKSMEDSKVLLFIITSRTRGLETMVLASYYIGCGKNVVLCIQNLTENCVIENETLSKVAVNDYNRGRVYLRDLASRSGVPVYENIADAVQAAIAKCNNSFNAFR